VQNEDSSSSDEYDQDGNVIEKGAAIKKSQSMMNKDLLASLLKKDLGNKIDTQIEEDGKNKKKKKQEEVDHGP